MGNAIEEEKFQIEYNRLRALSFLYKALHSTLSLTTDIDRMDFILTTIERLEALK